MPVDSKLVERFKPIAYIPKESEGDQLIDVLLETGTGYALLWYHWPHDDYTGKEDYEPVVLFFMNDLLAGIGIRPHERYRFSPRYLTEGSRPVVVFETPWHAPVLYQGRARDILTSGFASPFASIRKDDYQLTPGRPPEWYVKDGTDLSVYEFAAQRVRDLGI